MTDNVSGYVRQVLVHTATLLASITAIFGAGWFLVEPRIEDWIQGQNESIVVSLQAVETQIAIISAQIDADPPRLLDFAGNGVVVAPGPFRPGSVVPVGYHMRRNDDCPSRVEVRFYSAVLGRIASNHTHVLPSTRASITQDFQFFVISVSLPDDMSPGLWSYQPVIVPDCPEYGTFTVPPSQFFEVSL